MWLLRLFALYFLACIIADQANEHELPPQGLTNRTPRHLEGFTPIVTSAAPPTKPPDTPPEKRRDTSSKDQRQHRQTHEQNNRPSRTQASTPGPVKSNRLVKSRKPDYYEVTGPVNSTRPGKSRKPNYYEVMGPVNSNRPGKSRKPNYYEMTGPVNSTRPEKSRKPYEVMGPVNSNRPVKSRKPDYYEVTGPVNSTRPEKSRKPNYYEMMGPVNSNRPGKSRKPNYYEVLIDDFDEVTGNASAKLAVKDNHKPMFLECYNYKPTVKEEAPPGTYVFTIKATDNDPPETGGTVTYKFVTTPGEKERFHLETHTGKIFTADIFDHDEPSREKETYITVRVTDNGQPSLDDACTIKITIEDVNDNPPVFDKVNYAESVPADLQVGREVMRISATDIDDGQNSVVHYELDPSSPDSSYFNIDPDSGVIFLKKAIDKFPGYKFKLSAIVKDMGEPPQQSSITLDVTVVESNKKSPSFTEVPKEVIRIKENYGDFVNPIAVVRARSNTPDDDSVQFELVQGQTEQTNKLHTFVLEPDGDKAYIKLGSALDYEKINEYTLTVRIQNNYRLAAETIINIELEDVNDNIPVFSEIRSGTVSENEARGTPVMQVRAIDLDGTSANNQVTYYLADPSEPFEIDSITGNITTTETFDRETRSFYNIKVIAIDNSESALIKGKHNIGQQTFIIEIADKNDNAPHFSKDTYVAESIAENANINELVTQVFAADNDTASIVSYDIVDGNQFKSFTVKNLTGEIRVNGPLDYENITEYKLDVRASDGTYEDYCKVIIRIENLNDNPPIFLDNYTKTIEEERLYEGCIVKLEAYDPDIVDRNAPQNIVFSLVKHEQKEFLDVNNDGCLRLTKPLDRDQPTGFVQWQVIIMATDAGGKLGPDSLRSTTEVILELTDINDNAPFLTNTQPVIWYENQSGGQVVILTAKDYDSPENGPPFTFALDDSSGYDVKNKFKIQGNVLYAITAFDRENTKEYFVPILITDSGTPRMTGLSILHVVIGDRNDNPMGPGFSSIFVYNYKGDSPDTEVGRIYVEDPDDWDLHDKKFTWLPSFEQRSPYFDVNSQTGMITMRQGTPNGTYTLTFNVTEQNEPIISFHWVEATVNVTVKEIPEEAVDKSGSVRFVNTTAEQFILPESDGTSKKDKFHHRLAKLFNVSLDNVDVFTVSNKQTVKDEFLDIRFSAHGSPYYSPEKLNAKVTGIQDELEEELSLKIYMVNIDECLIEREQCEDSCRNVLIKSNVPLAVYTNTTSFIGVSARIESECTCEGIDQLICLNGGTPFADKCECAEGYLGPRCERTSIGFHGDGWAMYPAPPACHEGHITLTVVAMSSNSLIFYMGPLNKNQLLPIEDFMSLELVEGFPVLLVNYGSGTTKLNNSVVHVADGKPHLIEIVVMRTSIEMFVDRCKLTTCMSLAAPTGTKEILNINGPLQLGGSNVDLRLLSTQFNWRHTPSNKPFVGCIHNFTYNDYMYNLGEPAYHKHADPSCQKSMYTAVTFGIDTNFLVTILVCAAILIILLLAVVVHRRRQDTWAEKELDDIRENIITYDDEGGGEQDAGYDLQVLRQMFGTHPDTWKNITFMRRALLGNQVQAEKIVDCANLDSLAGFCFSFLAQRKTPRLPPAETQEEAAGPSISRLRVPSPLPTIPSPPATATIHPVWQIRPSRSMTLIDDDEGLTEFREDGKGEVQVSVDVHCPPQLPVDVKEEVQVPIDVQSEVQVPVDVQNVPVSPPLDQHACPTVQVLPSEVYDLYVRPPPPPASTVRSEQTHIYANMLANIGYISPPSPAPPSPQGTITIRHDGSVRFSRSTHLVSIPEELDDFDDYETGFPGPTRFIRTIMANMGIPAIDITLPSRARRTTDPDLRTRQYLDITPPSPAPTTPYPDLRTRQYLDTTPPSPAPTPYPDLRTRQYLDTTPPSPAPTTPYPDLKNRQYLEITPPSPAPTTPYPDLRNRQYLEITPPSPAPRTPDIGPRNHSANIRRSGSRARPTEHVIEMDAIENIELQDYNMPAAAPDISGFLDDKKEVLDRDPDAINPYDDVRHYAYEGDGETTGSLSSLASCTDDDDQNFTYLHEYGPQFSKLADLYGDGGDDIPEPKMMPQRSNEESWC